MADIATPRTDTDTRLLLFSGRLTDPALLEHGTRLRPTGDCALVAAGFQRDGPDVLERMVGDFAFAVIDPARGSLFMARDALGTKPLYYRIDPGVVAVATTAAALKLPGMPLTPDPEWIARYSWMSLSEDFERTAYAEIKKLMPGHCLSVEPGKSPAIRRWHEWRQREATPDSSKASVETYRERLVEAVTGRLGTTRPVGFEASGGLDSSSVMAAALRSGSLSPQEACAYGYGLCEQEPDAIRSVAEHLGIDCTHIYSTPDPLDVAHMDRALAAIGYPEESSIASSYWRLHRDVAARGATHLLSGFGGDEAVSSLGTPARDEWFADRNFVTLYNSFAGNGLRRAIGFGRFLTSRRNAAAPREFRKAWRARWPYCLLTDDAIQAFGIEQRFMATAAYGGEAKRINATILGYHFASPSLSTRFENCTLVGASWGLHYAWPLCDVRLIEAYLAAPTSEKFGPGGATRYLHRRAVSGWLPDSVVWRPHKSMGPVRNSALATGLAVSEWARGGLAPALQGIIDPAKVSRASKLLSDAQQFGAGVISSRSSLAALAWLNRWLTA